MELAFQLERWIDPAKYGWYSGDHHIHAAGCSHYKNPTEGVDPARHDPPDPGRGAEHRLGADLGARLLLPEDSSSRATTIRFPSPTT